MEQKKVSQMSQKVSDFLTQFRRFNRVVKERKNLAEAIRLGKAMDELFERLSGKEKQEAIDIADFETRKVQDGVQN